MVDVVGHPDEVATPGESEARPTASRRRLSDRLSMVTRVALVMIAVQLGVRALFVRDSYFFQDDFGHLDLARRLGLTQEYLVRDYGGHLEVGQYLMIWVFSHFMDDSFGFATTTIVVMQGIVSVILWVVLRQLFGRSKALLVPFAVYLFTPLALTWSMWWAAAIQTLPLQLFTLVAIWGAVHHLRDGRRSGAVVSVLAQVGGLFFWEKAAFILPTVLAVHLLVVSTGGVRERVVSLLRRPWMWVAHLVVLVSYVAIYFSLVESVAERHALDGVEFVERAVFRMTVPGLFGGPWHAEGAEWTVYPYTDTSVAIVAAAAMAVIAWTSFRVTGSRALGAWILVVGYLAADLTLLALGRADFLAFLSTDPRYVADALPVITIGLAAAFRGVLEKPMTPRAVQLASRITPRSVAAVVVALFLSGLVTQLELAPKSNHEYARNYTRGLLGALESDPEKSVVNAPVPYELSARTDLSQFLGALTVDRELDRPDDQVYVVDNFGALRAAGILGGERIVAPTGTCGWALDGDPTALGETEVEAGWPTLLRVAYSASTPTELVITTGEEQQTYEVESGAGEVYFVVPPFEGPVEAQTAQTAQGDSLCVSEIEVGPAWAK